MKISRRELKETVLQFLTEMERETITKPSPTEVPGTRPSPNKRPSPLMPPKEAPKPNPKGVYNESDTISKIEKRYNSLSEGKKKSINILEIVQGILNEDLIDTFKEKYISAGKITQEVLDEILGVTKGNVSYTLWLGKHVAEKHIESEDIYKYVEFFRVFNTNKRDFREQDINRYNTVGAVRYFEQRAIEIKERNVVHRGETDGKNFVSSTGIGELASVGIKFIGITDGYQVFEVPPTTKGNAESYRVFRKHLGKCSGRETGATIISCIFGSQSHYDGYFTRHPNSSYQILFNLSDTLSPYTFHYESGQFKDKNNKQII